MFQFSKPRLCIAVPAWTQPAAGPCQALPPPAHPPGLSRISRKAGAGDGHKLPHRGSRKP